MPDRRKDLLVFYERTRRRISIDRVKPRTLAYFSMMLLLIGLAGGLYLHQASEVATYAKEIRRLQSHKERLRRELVALQGEVALLGSLERMHQVGEDLGYRLPEAADVKERLYIECTPTPAVRRTDRSLFGKQRGDSETSGVRVKNTFWQNLVEQFYLWFESPADQRWH
ncbi:MAG: hypothetical protein R6V13_01470 [Anaerolineae bacterium]